MRIAYLNYEWDLQESVGAAAHISELTAGLRRLGHEVLPSNRRRRREGPVTLRPTGAQPASWRARLAPWLHESSALLRVPRHWREEIRLLTEQKPDVVLARYSLHQISSLFAARWLGLPIVFEVNASAAYEYRRYLPHYKLLPGFAETVERFAFARADGMFVVSAALKDYFTTFGVPADKIAVVPNGADPDVFRPDVADAELRAAMPSDTTLIGFVGSFSSFHGIEMLKQLIAELCPGAPNVRFLFVGEGARSGDLREFCAKTGFADRARFTGHVARDSVPALMAACDVLVAPYGREAFFYFSPIKLFEYMACGRAVLAARIGQVAEVVRDGVTGLLYEPGDTADMIGKLRVLIDDAALRRRLGVAARDAIVSTYSWEANATRVAAVLTRAVEGRAPQATFRSLASERRR